jgi:putative NIF3 family GTP cyclohydrolase 1 type 2
MTTVEALQKAVDEKCELVICHETVMFPNGAPSVDGGDYLTWEVNRRRMALIQQGDLCIQRLHTSLDVLCILDDFAERLGLGKASLDEGNLVKVFDIEPTPFAELVERTKKAVGMAHLRASPAASERMVKRVGLPWGGLGLFRNMGYQEALAKHGCDLFIYGETDNYSMRFAEDSGILFIETSHEASENIGLKHFADLANKEFAEVEFIYFENRVPWRIV